MYAFEFSVAGVQRDLLGVEVQLCFFNMHGGLGKASPNLTPRVHVDFQGRSGGKQQFSQLRETPVPPLPSPAGRMGGIMPSSHSSSAGARHWVCCSEPSCGWQVAGLGCVATYSPILSKITPRDHFILS